MGKKIQDRKPTLESLFKPDELAPLEGNWTGKLLVMRPSYLKAEFCTRKFLVWRATGGFGCDPSALGRAVYAVCAGDGEDARWDRGAFAYEFVGDPNNLKE